jgi:uncharacterized protein (DUF697 family)
MAKKLPRAVQITADQMRGAAAPDLQVVAPGPEPVVDQFPDAVPAPLGTDGGEGRHEGRNEGRKTGPVMASPVLELTAVGGAPAAASPGVPDAAQIKAWAQDVVHRHAAYSVFGGIIPLPLVNAASVAAINVRMVKVLSQLYGVPFEQGRARALVISLMGGIMPTGVGAITASTLFYIIPGSTLLGLAMSSVTAAACTRAIGRVFVEHFASGATTLDVPAIPTR